MIITAKFPAVCPCCSGRINAGDKIEWSKGEKAKHVGCAGKPVTKSASAAPAYRARRPRGARYCEGWGADNPHAPRPPYTCTECECDA